jgi:hypothetical protein
MDQMTKNTITLVHNYICPFAHRALITAIEKNIDYSVVEVDLKNKN